MCIRKFILSVCYDSDRSKKLPVLKYVQFTLNMSYLIEWKTKLELYNLTFILIFYIAHNFTIQNRLILTHYLRSKVSNINKRHFLADLEAKEYY